MDSYESQPDATGNMRLFMWWVLIAQVFGLTSVILGWYTVLNFLLFA